MSDLVYITNVEELDEVECYDIWNYDQRCQDRDGGNFFLNGVLTHNSIPEAMANRADPDGSWREQLAAIHPQLLRILEKTYGVICYQEQLAAILQVIGGFTSPEAQEMRKAVAKKNKAKLVGMKKKWMEGATKTIGAEHAENIYNKLEFFGRYAFNQCLSQSTMLREASTGIIKPVVEWFENPPADLLSYDGDNVFVDKCVTIHENDEQEVFEITLDDGSIERVTANHRFLGIDGNYYTMMDAFNGQIELHSIKTN